MPRSEILYYTYDEESPKYLSFLLILQKENKDQSKTTKVLEQIGTYGFPKAGD
jgi:hypothetical protein